MKICIGMFLHKVDDPKEAKNTVVSTVSSSDNVRYLDIQMPSKPSTEYGWHHARGTVTWL